MVTVGRAAGARRLLPVAALLAVWVPLWLVRGLVGPSRRLYLRRRPRSILICSIAAGKRFPPWHKKGGG